MLKKILVVFFYCILFQVCSRWYSCSKRVVKNKKKLFRKAVIDGPVAYLAVPSNNTVESPTTSFSTVRFSHSACIYGSDMYVFGGCTPTSTTFNDLWKIDLKTKKKGRLLTTGNYPTPKAHASMVVLDKSLVLFGGWTSQSVFQHQEVLFDELHVYDIEQNTWMQAYFPYSPPPTAGHSATVHDNIVVVFGGMQKTLITSISSNDIFCIDFARSEWFRPKVSSPSPDPRAGQSQIKIDERHALILSGCSGYNHRHNDAWLLIMPENLRTGEWRWKKLAMKSMELMPKQLWCNPVCKVDDHVVVLAEQNEPDDEGKINKAQFFRPAILHPNKWLPPVDDGPRRGEAPEEPPRPNGPSPPNNEALSPDKILGHPKPSIRPNASSNREKRLSMLSKYEERIKEKKKTGVTKSEVKPPCCMRVYLLDISRCLSDNIVTWKTGPAWNTAIPPHPRTRCTLLLGRGELVLCCGKETGECTCNPAVTLPQLVYISAPDML